MARIKLRSYHEQKNDLREKVALLSTRRFDEFVTAYGVELTSEGKERLRGLKQPLWFALRRYFVQDLRARIPEQRAALKTLNSCVAKLVIALITTDSTALRAVLTAPIYMEGPYHKDGYEDEDGIAFETEEGFMCEQTYMRLFTILYNISEGIINVLKSEEYSTKQTKRPNHAAIDLVDGLIGIYEELFPGKKAKKPYFDQVNNQYNGPFFRFVAAIMKHFVHEHLTPRQVAYRINQSIKSRKSKSS